jgi:hypothetical protein
LLQTTNQSITGNRKWKAGACAGIYKPLTSSAVSDDLSLRNALRNPQHTGDFLFTAELIRTMIQKIREKM